MDVVAEGKPHTLREISSNFSDYEPEADERIKLVGVLGQQSIRVAFTKTARLCDDKKRYKCAKVAD